MRRGIWATLDCDPTSDRGAIRRAYAARLKAMDVDADPDAFEALRDARDAALARVADPVADVDVAAVDLPDAPLAPMTEFTLEQEPEPEAEVDALAEAMNAHFHALEALLSLATMRHSPQRNWRKSTVTAARCWPIRGSKTWIS